MNTYVIKEYGHDDKEHNYIVIHHYDDIETYEGNQIVEQGETKYLHNIYNIQACNCTESVR